MALTREQQIANLRRAQAAESAYQQEAYYGVPPANSRNQQTIEEATIGDIANYPNILPMARKLTAPPRDILSPYRPQPKPRYGEFPADYWSEMGYNTPPINPYTDAFVQSGATDLGSIISQTPLDAANARNRAQQAEVDSKRLQNAYQSVMDSQKNAAGMGFGTIDKNGVYKENKSGVQTFPGFNPEKGRKYSTEKDAAGNIIGIHALQTAAESALGGMAPGVLESKSWSAPGSDGGAGHPFTPNLDKFKARQDPNILAQTMAGMNPDDIAQMRYAQEGAKVGTIPALKEQQEIRAQKMRDIGINPLTKETYASSGMRPSGQAVITKGTLDTAPDATAAWEQGKQSDDQWEKVGSSLFNQADQLKKERIERMSAKSPMSTIGDYKSAQAEQTARDAGSKAINQYGKALGAAAKSSQELASIPKTEITKMATPYGEAYVSPTSTDPKIIKKAEEKKILDKGGNA